MLKEFKYIIYTLVVITFFFLILKYYFSDDNIKNSYKSISSIDSKLNIYNENLIILKNNTENIIEYAENKNKKKKKYYFWDLIKTNE
mgnify:FL=1|tara:strand:- start:128 stop:388 length:261 start_codon:yes stop_codon:yes gene_type:complete